MEFPSFLRRLKQADDAIALIDITAHANWTYADLHAQVQSASAYLKRESRGLVLIFPRIDADSIILYLAALNAGHAVFLSPLSLRDPEAAGLIQTYRPEIIVASVSDMPDWSGTEYLQKSKVGNYDIFARQNGCDAPPHPALALLLSTSASTGKSKTVRLSRSGVSAAADQVTASLGLQASSRALVSLPFSYVYGLSVIHSVLGAGGALVVNGGSISDPAYWRRVDGAGVTMIAAISEVLDLMRKLRITTNSLTQLRQLTHSGAALDVDLFRWVHEHFCERGVKLHLMYGQTEAGGRISVLEPEALPARHRSVGKVIEGSEITIGDTGEIRYRGPGVMMGYATARADLLLGDVQRGVLSTGDVGFVDGCGYLYLTGRISRYAKIFGRRIHLDEVEAYLASDGSRVAVIDTAGRLEVFVEATTPGTPSLVPRLANQFRLPPQHIHVIQMDALPRTSVGKICYSSLRARAQK